MDLRGFLRILGRRWLSVTLLTLMGLGAGIGATALATPVYEARSQLFVSTRASGGDSAQLNQGSAFSQARVQSYANIVATRRVTEPVIARLDLDMTSDQLASRITTEAPLNTVLIDIMVKDTVPARSARMADEVAAEFSRQVGKLETPPGARESPVHLGITRTAAVPTVPVSPKPLLNAGIGLLGGLLAGAAFATLRETLDTTLRSRQALADATGLPVLGAVPYDKMATERPLVVGRNARGSRAEAIRLVRTNLQFTQVDRRPRVIVVTSPLPGEGKTSIATNLALVLAEAGQATCLIDADLRRPRVARKFGLIEGAGLTSVLIGMAGTADVLQPVGDGRLSVLTSGPVPPNPAEILASERMRQLLMELAGAFDTVIVDSAPLLPVADTPGLSPFTDGAVLVVRAGSTPRERVQAGVETLRAVGTPMLGTVLNMANLAKAQGYGYGYGGGAAGAGGRKRVESHQIPPRPRPSRTTSGTAAMSMGMPPSGHTDRTVPGSAV